MFSSRLVLPDLIPFASSPERVPDVCVAGSPLLLDQIYTLYLG